MKNTNNKNSNPEISYKKELFYKNFIQRENNFLRAPYNPEINFYNSIKNGDVKTITELCKETLLEKSGLGKLSDNEVQNIRYHFVVTTALAARYCINGGMDLQTAYNLSDYYIQKADKCKTAKEVSDLHQKMCLDYTKRMKDLKKSTICSKPIVKCIDYIYDHLHNRITVEELAKYVNINPTYLSRLFKKEVGISISEYIRKQKIDTAKNMLLYSDYKPGQIAQILAFPSQSYFTEIFKKYTGLTPNAYKKSGIQI